MAILLNLVKSILSNNDESEYNEQISEVVQWCKAHNLLLNTAKTKELIFDFCKLKWSNHCTLIVSKCKQRLFFLRLLNSFGVKHDSIRRNIQRYTPITVDQTAPFQTRKI